MADAGPFADETPQHERPRLDIALVNLSPDATFQATERQFVDLIGDAAGPDFDIRLTRHTLDGVPRGDEALTAIAQRYDSVEQLKANGADGVIVTDTLATKANLLHEPYWAELTALVGWAHASSRSTLWSGRAAEAAVLTLDRLATMPLATPCTGVFTFERVREDRLTRGLPGLIRMPHARRRSFDPAALTAKGYSILTQSPRAGVDLFTRADQSLFVFLQGHPEYDADTLLRQYCREVGRYVRGEQLAYPQSPFGYFDADTEQSFRMLALRARSDQQAQLLSVCGEIARAAELTRPWRPPAVALFRNWLETLATAKIGATQTRELA